MSDPAVVVRQVCKRFRKGESNDSLRDVLASMLRRRRDPALGTFWALRDVSFAVQRGEALGVIGPNGAGKSTLLKLLAGILRPESGSLDLDRPVSALIELGAGFHGDLTGEENIYLNASILGMTRRDTRRRFDDIVEFAGIREFLDMPVKRYSSGMQARLGFAIAAHVEPRVLLVDEVLSVGDRVFRARCMDRMRQFMRDGVAIVFVSHDLATVSRFCDRTLVLAGGRTAFLGPTADAMQQYYTACAAPLLSRETGIARVERIQIEHANGDAVTRFEPGAAAKVTIDVHFSKALPRPSFGISLVRSDDHLIVFETSSTRLDVVCDDARPGDVHRVEYILKLNVAPGEYTIGVHVRDRDALQYAIQEMSLARIMVGGSTAAGGVAYLAPRVNIEPRQPHAPGSTPERTLELTAI